MSHRNNGFRNHADPYAALLAAEINRAVRDVMASNARRRKRAQRYLFADGGGLRRAVAQLHERAGCGPTVEHVRDMARKRMTEAA